MTLQAKAMMRIGLVLAALLVVLDQLSKWWILEVVMQPPRVVEVTPFFNLVLTWNRGVSFGLFSSESAYGPWLLAGLAAVIIIGLAFWLARADTRLQAVAIGMIIGGAIGNVVDRLRFGAVVDFLDFHAAGFHFWAFNVADSAISVGVALLLLDALFMGGRSPTNTTQQAVERGE